MDGTGVVEPVSPPMWGWHDVHKGWSAYPFPGRPTTVLTLPPSTCPPSPSTTVLSKDTVASMHQVTTGGCSSRVRDLCFTDLSIVRLRSCACDCCFVRGVKERERDRDGQHGHGNLKVVSGRVCQFRDTWKAITASDAVVKSCS